MHTKKMPLQRAPSLAKDFRKFLEQLFLGFRHTVAEPEKAASRLGNGTRASEDAVTQIVAFSWREFGGKCRRVGQPCFKHGGRRRVRQPALHELAGWTVSDNTSCVKAGDNGAPFLVVESAVGPRYDDERHQPKREERVRRNPERAELVEHSTIPDASGRRQCLLGSF